MGSSGGARYKQEPRLKKGHQTREKHRPGKGPHKDCQQHPSQPRHGAAEQRDRTTSAMRYPPPPAWLPACRKCADSGEKHRGLHFHMESEGEVPIVPFHVARASRVLEVQDSFQSLKS